MNSSKNEKKESSTFSKKLFSRFENYSIRSQILVTFFFSCLILAFIVIFLTHILRTTMTTVGESYQTNADLDNYLTLLSDTESALETYMQYRTFESIDKYFHFLALSEENAETLQSKPSAILVQQKEYIIRQLSMNFFSLSGNLVAARRSNNAADIEKYYAKTLECYSFLRDEILSLNMLYFKSNAEAYKSNKESTMILLNVSIIMMFLLLVFAILFIYFSISRITFPLAEISAVALKVADRNFNVEMFNSTRHDEIGNICRAFDSMIVSIQKYIDTIWKKAKQ